MNLIAILITALSAHADLIWQTADLPNKPKSTPSIYADPNGTLPSAEKIRSNLYKQGYDVRLSEVEIYAKTPPSTSEVWQVLMRPDGKNPNEWAHELVSPEERVYARFKTEADCESARLKTPMVEFKKMKWETECWSYTGGTARFIEQTDYNHAYNVARACMVEQARILNKSLADPDLEDFFRKIPKGLIPIHIACYDATKTPHVTTVYDSRATVETMTFRPSWNLRIRTMVGHNNGCYTMSKRALVKYFLKIKQAFEKDGGKGFKLADKIIDPKTHSYAAAAPSDVDDFIKLLSEATTIGFGEAEKEESELVQKEVSTGYFQGELLGPLEKPPSPIKPPLKSGAKPE